MYRGIGRPLGATTRGLGAREWDDVQEWCPGVFVESEKDFCPFSRALWSTDEVYVMRFHVTGLDGGIQTASQALRWANAYGNTLMTQCMPFGCPSIERQDVKGIVFDSQGGPGVYGVDLVVTTQEGGAPLFGQRGVEATVKLLNKDPDLLSVWPNLHVDDLQPLLMLNETAAQKARITDWRAAPTVWSWELWEQNEDAPEKTRGKTDAYGKGEGVWLGGTAAHPQARLKPKAPTPVGPPTPKPPTPKPPTPKPPEPGPLPSKAGLNAGTVAGVALVAGVGWFAFGTRIRDHLSGKKQKEKQHVLQKPW